MFQGTKTERLDRKDHVWMRYGKAWKCVICGAICSDSKPPDYPTDKGYMPERWDKLTEDERELAPFNKGGSY